MELIDTVSSVIISNDLTQMVSFPAWILDCDSQSPSFLDFLLASDASVCCRMAFPLLEISDHVISVSIDFLSNSEPDALFYS